MFAGAAKVEITPAGSVWMDGMIREGRSTGIHDRLYARALVLVPAAGIEAAVAFVSVDVCALGDAETAAMRAVASSRTGIPAAQILVAASHTHSGPATHGYFNPREEGYTRNLPSLLAGVVMRATANLRPAAVGGASGREETISHYRRLLADDGHVVMNWEPFPPERIVRPLGEADPEVGVLKVVDAVDRGRVLAILFNHAGHPNVLSGDNYELSADYPGLAARLLEEEFGGIALFLNGAQGSVDIDGLRDRDWAGVERAGTALARAVAEAAGTILPEPKAPVHSATTQYALPARRISDAQHAWAEGILRETGGKVDAMADGVGADYLARLYTELRAAEGNPIPVAQTCVAVGDTAFLTFPGELYTEIGRRIKQESLFARTYIVGLCNGHTGYIPTRKAIGEGGYAEDTRRVDAAAEEIVVEQSLALIRRVHENARDPRAGGGTP